MGYFNYNSHLLVFLISVSSIKFTTAEINVYHKAVTVNSSELSIIQITPDLFQWEKTPGTKPRRAGE